MKDKFNIAILIDADNAQASSIKEIIAEVSKYGKATIRRIYGDWTNPILKPWKDVLNDYSINPIQKFEYTVGKNSSDSSLIIDAMDILHIKNIDGFCIVSSDSDFTGLAKRIREEGLFVMGIGRNNTPKAFVNSCEIFTFTENLVNVKLKETLNDEAKSTKIPTPKITNKSDKLVAASDKKNKKLPLPQDELIKIEQAFEIATNENDIAYISKVGTALRKIDPSFDSRTFGFKNLTQLFENIEKFTVVQNEVNGLNHPLVKIS
jgi:uncharacterized LabA/DUF88 family protein